MGRRRRKEGREAGTQACGGGGLARCPRRRHEPRGQTTRAGDRTRSEGTTGRQQASGGRAGATRGAVGLSTGHLPNRPPHPNRLPLSPGACVDTGGLPGAQELTARAALWARLGLKAPPALPRGLRPLRVKQ